MSKEMFQLISDEEPVREMAVGPGVINYKRLPASRVEVLRRKHTKKGKLNEMAFRNDLFAEGAESWKGFALGGKEVDLTPENLRRLPFGVQIDLANNIIGEDETITEESEGN